MSTAAHSSVLESRKNTVRKFLASEFQYWFGHVANWTFVISAFAFAVTSPQRLGAVASVLAIASGLFIWTFAEYAFHRWLYHKNMSFFAAGHDVHHDAPTALVGTPWIINTVWLVTLTTLLSLLIGRSLACWLMGSFWLGHIWYSLMHHAVHQWSFNSKWYRRLMAHHKIHHKIADKNLGVTTLFWDRVFKTRI
jgi:4-hydroxysphinganine ceramide fatty acyl 2-hydroxylase